ncbi:hypothetical protein [Streptomyces sp. NPDC096339]|uniref:hypothetical protein n=1 Tax=Streptomyces sp. NPDC096339 TaxID=3366086 RepID=UPI00382888B6
MLSVIEGIRKASDVVRHLDGTGSSTPFDGLILGACAALGAVVTAACLYRARMTPTFLGLTLPVLGVVVRKAGRRPTRT